MGLRAPLQSLLVRSTQNGRESLAAGQGKAQKTGRRGGGGKPSPGFTAACARASERRWLQQREALTSNRPIKRYHPVLTVK